MPASDRSPIHQLFLGAAGLIRVRWQPVLIGTICFAMILAVASSYVQRRTAKIENELATALSISHEELREEVDRQVLELGQLPLAQFMEKLDLRYGEPVIGDGAPALTKENLGVTYVVRMTPFVAGMAALSVLIGFIASVFFLVLFASGRESPYDVLKRLPLDVLRMIGLQLWTLVRSLLWIPFVGPFIAVYMMPRLSLAPTIFLSGEARVFESLHLSMKRTSGRWLSIVLRLLCIGLITILLLWPLLVAVSVVSLFSLKIGFFLWLVAVMGVLAWVASCMTVLAVTFA